jgi:hypothetical protein
MTKVDRVVPKFKGVIQTHICSDISADTLENITARLRFASRYLIFGLKIVWMGFLDCV